MTIDEAIKILDVHQEMLRLESMPDLYDAVKLGIEALQAIRTGREDFYEAGGNLLPGETE